MYTKENLEFLNLIFILKNSDNIFQMQGALSIVLRLSKGHKDENFPPSKPPLRKELPFS